MSGVFDCLCMTGKGQPHGESMRLGTAYRVALEHINQRLIDRERHTVVIVPLALVYRMLELS